MTARLREALERLILASLPALGVASPDILAARAALATPILDRRDFVAALQSSSAPTVWNDAIAAALRVMDGEDTIANLFQENQ